MMCSCFQYSGYDYVCYTTYLGIYKTRLHFPIERRGNEVVSTSACHADGRGSIPGPLRLSDETLKAVGPFYMVSIPGEVKYPTSLHW